MKNALLRLDNLKPPFLALSKGDQLELVEKVRKERWLKPPRVKKAGGVR